MKFLNADLWRLMDEVLALGAVLATHSERST